MLSLHNNRKEYVKISTKFVSKLSQTYPTSPNEELVDIESYLVLIMMPKYTFMFINARPHEKCIFHFLI